MIPRKKTAIQQVKANYEAQYARETHNKKFIRILSNTTSGQYFNISFYSSSPHLYDDISLALFVHSYKRLMILTLFFFGYYDEQQLTATERMNEFNALKPIQVNE